MAKKPREPWKPGDRKPRKPDAPRTEEPGNVGLGLSVPPAFRREIHILAAHRGESVSKILMDAAAPLLKGIHVRFAGPKDGGEEQAPGRDGEASGPGDDGFKIAG